MSQVSVFFSPFTANLWIAIIFCLVFNSAVLYILEADSPQFQGRSHLNALLHSFLQTFMLLVASMALALELTLAELCARLTSHTA